MSREGAPLLEVRGLRAGYDGIPVLFGVDLALHEGEIVTLLGANGAGKTSTLRAISGMIQIFAGDISFGGELLNGRTADRIARGGLLHIPAGRGIFPTLLVGETLRLAAALAVGRKGNAGERVDEALDVFPRLAERLNQPAGTLSGGEQQMLAMARGLIARPRLLMIDEMSQGLAPTIVAELFRIVAGFPALGVSVLLVEQFVGQALAIAGRAYVLEKGEVGFEGPAATLAADAEFVQGSYLGDAAVERVAVAATDASTRRELTEEVSVSLPPILLRTLEERSAREGVSVADLVRSLVEAEGNGHRIGGAPRPAPSRKRRTAGRKDEG